MVPRTALAAGDKTGVLGITETWVTGRLQRDTNRGGGDTTDCLRRVVPGEETTVVKTQIYFVNI